MLWLRDGTQRKTLQQMKERGELAEWLRGALVPSIRRLLRDSNGDLWFSITAFASPSSCNLQARCWHAGFKYMGATETLTGLDVSDRFRDLANATMVASG